ncbi:MAG: carbohydrate-binding family 9-like protein [Candidatus Methylacidiphilales bacterium]|nr:carbohydrate-binding family 9-like protein [Candidatus Methylacidiphilales bacterium]
MRTPFLVLAVISVLSNGLSGSALVSGLDSGPPPVDGHPRISVPHALEQPRITADSQDPAWNSAAEIGSLIPCYGSGQPSTEPVSPTKIRLLWDSSHLYLRFLCAGRPPINSQSGRDADLYRGDVVEVFLSRFADARMYFEIQVSPKNDVLDLRFNLPGSPDFQSDGVLSDNYSLHHLKMDRAWNFSKLKTASRVSDGQWIVDLAIPADELAGGLTHPELAPGWVRANFLRYEWVDVSQKPALLPSNWSVVRHGCPHISPGSLGWLRLVQSTEPPSP